MAFEKIRSILQNVFYNNNHSLKAVLVPLTIFSFHLGKLFSVFFRNANKSIKRFNENVKNLRRCFEKLNTEKRGNFSLSNLTKILK